jgi:hypothetical protein
MNDCQLGTSTQDAKEMRTPGDATYHDLCELTTGDLYKVLQHNPRFPRFMTDGQLVKAELTKSLLLARLREIAPEFNAHHEAVVRALFNDAQRKLDSKNCLSSAQQVELDISGSSSKKKTSQTNCTGTAFGYRG